MDINEDERVSNITHIQYFWSIIKPFLNTKGWNFQSDVILNENDNLLTSQSEDICDVFNNFFVNVAKVIGKDYVPVDVNHPRIL